MPCRLGHPLIILPSTTRNRLKSPLINASPFPPDTRKLRRILLRPAHLPQRLRQRPASRSQSGVEQNPRKANDRLNSLISAGLRPVARSST